MKVLGFSDWRSQPIDHLHRMATGLAGEVDFVVYAGDDLARFLEEGTNHLDKLARELDTDVGFVRGNDDEPQSFGRPVETDRVHDLHRDPYRHGGFVFVGQEGAIGETAMGFIKYSEEEAESHLNEFEQEFENRHIILVTHTPPFGVLDIGRRYGERHLGSKAVRDFAKSAETDLVVCGHVHQFGGKHEECEFGTVVNIASHDDRNADGRIALIDLSVRDVLVEHTTTDAFLADPLTKLTQVGESRADELRAQGFENIEDLTEERREDLLDTKYIDESIVDRVLGHATAYQRGEPIVTDSEPFARLRDRNPVIVDIETNLAQDHIWLIGTYDYATDEFIQFFSLDDEARVCKRFLEFLRGREPSPVAYYAGQGFDERLLSERTAHYGKDLDSAVGEWVDVCQLARRAVFTPAEGHNLETVAGGLGFEFAYPDVTGFDVGAAYAKYLSGGEEADWNVYREYNRDDVLAVKHVIDEAARW